MPTRLTAQLDRYQAALAAAQHDLAARRIVPRIWQRDHTVWRPNPDQIANRLGWLHAAEDMAAHESRLNALAQAARAAGYTDVLLLGMGGSSLAPEVFSRVFGAQPGHPRLAVLDSTDPGAVLAYADRLDPARTLFIVSTKSGTTVETLSFAKFFYNWTAQALGAAQAGAHFVAITDPGSKLADLAEQLGFGDTLLNDPHIGGRFSVLSYFGLAPAALLGLDVPRLLGRAQEMMAACGPEAPLAGNPGAQLGLILGELARAGRNKMSLVASPAIASFGDWVEQLVAESTGKEGVGIVPVVGEPLGPPAAYGDDRLFVYLRLDGDTTHDAALQALAAAGQPVVRLALRDAYDLGGQFFLWAMATAVAGHCLGVNPFDQPNVESAKSGARDMVTAYEQTGALPPGEPAPLTAAALREFLAPARPGAYIALQAYAQPTPETDVALLALRARLRDDYVLATTVGYGPRFLHSTGQLHKGDAGRGFFVQFTATVRRDAPIPVAAGAPAATITFGVLEAAQAAGDRLALLAAGRRVIHFHLGTDVPGALRRLTEALS